MDILATILGGGLTGLIGNIITSVTNYKMQKLKNTHEARMADIDLKTIRLEAEMQVKITEAETEGEVQIAEMDALKESYKQASKPLFDRAYMQHLFKSKWTSWIGSLLSLLFGIVDFLKGAARPILTYYLMGAATWITVLSYKMLKASTAGTVLDVDKAHQLFDTTTQTMIYLTVATVSWWFADRRISKYLFRLNDGNLKK